MLPGQCCIVMRQNQDHVMTSIIVPGDNKYCAFVEYKGCFSRLP